MDHIDREILQILQHNARASLKMIAEKTFLSSPAVRILQVILPLPLCWLSVRSWL